MVERRGWGGDGMRCTQVQLLAVVGVVGSGFVVHLGYDQYVVDKDGNGL